MATYAIGDIQGCLLELQRLLERIQFNPGKDTLWFTGDLVNRGPASLETLRFVQELGDNAVTVLGNHDIHLLAVAAGTGHLKSGDTLDDILAAEDRDQLLNWLRRRPLMHTQHGYSLIHAGLPPQWTIEDAQNAARSVEAMLSGPDSQQFLAHIYGNKPDSWDESLSGFDRSRFITNCFTRMRYCSIEGRLDFTSTCKPGNQDPGLIPWFELPWRRSRGANILFGHWASLGYREHDGCIGLDTGCLWGRELTALRIEGGPKQRYSVAADVQRIRVPPPGSSGIEFRRSG
jgi:bis(5'-nucleosyl)-tetraphosphatase (symmetrical)